MSAEEARERAWLRKIFPDVYQKTNQFVAVALTSGYTLTQGEADALGKQGPKAPTAGTTPATKWARQAFRGRILGDDSPHLFLPDPCDLGETESPHYTAALILEHTEFILTEDFFDNSGKGSVERNDRVNVFLDPGWLDAPFNLERGWAVGINQKRKYNSQGGKKAIDCTSLAGLFGGNSEPVVLTGGSGNPGTFGVDDEKTPNANKLRCFLKSLASDGFDVSGHGRLSEGGRDITEGAAMALANVMKELSKQKFADNLPNNFRVEIGGGNDDWHEGGNHRAGKAFDISVFPSDGPLVQGSHYNDGRENEYADDENVMYMNYLFASMHAGDNEFKWIDEYNYPSTKSTGPHFHLTYGSRWESGGTQRDAATHQADAATNPDTETWNKNILDTYPAKGCDLSDYAVPSGGASAVAAGMVEVTTG